MTWKHSRLYVFLLKDASCWLYEKYQDKDLDIQPLINLSTVFLSKLSEEPLISTTILWTNNSTNLFIASQLTAAYSVTYTAKKVIEKKKIYAETIRTTCKAINIAIKMDNLNVL
ncbi:9437_t:CDS:2, partial [Dentiscutata erythropus]